MTFKLVAVGSIKANLSKAVELKRNTTISALFHGLIANNVSFVTDMRKEDMADFDTVLRQLLPVKWDSANSRYGYSDKKALSSAEKMGMDLFSLRTGFKHGNKAEREEVLQAFYSVVMEHYNATEQEKKGKDLSADDKAAAAISKIKSGVKAAREQGASDTDILDMLAGMGVNIAAYVPVLERQKAA